MYFMEGKEAKLFNGRKALVVGGTSGIGSAVAAALINEGATITVTGRHSPSPAASFIPVDFERDGLDAVNDGRFKEALSSCDILCVCYGPFLQKPLDKTTAADWKKISLFDYALPGILTSTVLNSMIIKKWGRILLFGGTKTDTIRSCRTNAAYAGAKTGISVLVKSVASSYGKYNITCNAVLPGFVTNAPEGVPLVTAQDVAQKAIMLLSAPSLNGVLLTVDNGWNP